MKMKLKKGDKVLVISGKDKGKEGEIMRMLPLEGKVVIDGVAMTKRHLKRAMKGQSAGIVERPRAIDASNVMFLNADGKPTRVGRKVEDGKLVRFSKKGGATIK